jgi:hypothetical protein
VNVDVPLEIAAKRVQRGKDAGKELSPGRRLFDDAG